jgi:ankyrin repeat protein
MVDLITEYIGMEACDRVGQTLLHTASACGNVQMTKALIDSYVQNEGNRYTAGIEEAFLSRHVDKEGLSAMHYASHYGQIDVVNFLYEVMGQGAFSLRNRDGKTSLSLASYRGHSNVAQFCVDFGGQESIEWTDNEGRTALLSAIETENNNYDVIKLLIDSGADTSAVDDDEDSAMHYVSWAGRFEVAKLLYEVMGQGAFSLRDHDGSTPLILAILRNNEDVAQFCVEFGNLASINIEDDNGRTALHHASNVGNCDVVKLLIDSGADTSEVDNDGDSAMHIASSHGHFDVVKILAKRIGPGAFDLRNEFGNTPLIRASLVGAIDIVKFGVEFGAQTINTQNNHGMTVLSYFTYHDYDEDVDIDAVEFLLDSGANVDVSDSLGYTPVTYAVIGGKVDLLKLLIGSGANACTSCNHGGWEPIHCACVNTVNQVEILQLLIEAGGDITATTSNDQTPLHIASDEGNVEIVRAILKVEEAKPTLCFLDGDNRTPLDWAVNNGHEEIAALLELAMS